MAGSENASEAELERIESEFKPVIAAVKRGDGQAAFEALDKLIARYPDFPPRELVVGRLLLTGNHIQAARPWLENAAVQSPEYPGTYVTFARIALAEQRLTDAEALFEKVQSKTLEGSFPDGTARKFRADSLGGLAAVAERRGQSARARGLLLSCLEITHQRVDILQRLGSCCFQLNEREQAFKYFLSARAEDSSLRRALGDGLAM